MEKRFVEIDAEVFAALESQAVKHGYSSVDEMLTQFATAGVVPPATDKANVPAA